MGFTLFTIIELVLFSINSLVKFKDKRQLNIAAIAMFFVMFIFAGMRGSGEGDYYNYLRFAKDIGTDFSKVLNFNYPVELSFRFFSYLINIIGLSRQWIIVLMNALSIIPISYVTIKKSYNPFLSAIIFLPLFIQFDMQTSRTATAVGLSMMSLYLFSENKKIKSSLFFIFAVTFHRAAVILFPFLFLLLFEIGNGFKIFTVLIAFIASVFSSMMFRIAAQILKAFGMTRMATKVINYTFSGEFASSMSFFDPRILFGIALFITTIMYFNKKSFKKFSIEEVSIKAIRFSIMMLLIFRSSTAIAFRFSTFFTIMELIYIPLVLKEIRKIDKLGYFLIVLSVVIYLLPYAVFLMIKAPPYDFFFTNLQAITSLR